MAITTSCSNQSNQSDINGNGTNQSSDVKGNGANQSSEGNSVNASGVSVKENTGLDIANLREADSVQVLFFTDPYGKDSLRYTRFFKHFNTSDTSIVKPLLNNLDRMFILRNEVMPCRSEGKLFFFKGEQELKTVYFNTQSLVNVPTNFKPNSTTPSTSSTNSKSQSSDRDCAYMYFIKDGAFYYFPIQAATTELLLKLKPKAVKP